MTCSNWNPVLLEMLVETATIAACICCKKPPNCASNLIKAHVTAKSMAWQNKLLVHYSVASSVSRSTSRQKNTPMIY